MTYFRSTVLLYVHIFKINSDLEFEIKYLNISNIIIISSQTPLKTLKIKNIIITAQ